MSTKTERAKRPKRKVLSRDPPDDYPQPLYTKQDHPDAGLLAD